MSVCKFCGKIIIAFLENSHFFGFCSDCGKTTHLGHESRFKKEIKDFKFIPDLDDLSDEIFTPDINPQRDLIEEIPGFDGQFEEAPIDESDFHNVGFHYPDIPELEFEGAPPEILTNDI